MKKLLKLSFIFLWFSCNSQIAIINQQNSQKNNGTIVECGDTTPPTAASSLVVSSVGETTASLSWTASTDTNGISYYRIHNRGTTLISNTGSNSTTFNLTGLTPNTYYSITVRGVDPCGNIAADSNVQNFTTDEIGNTYALTENSKVSIGVFASDSTLLRTLEIFEPKTIGTHTVPSWDGLDNDGVDVSAQGDHYKIIAQNISVVNEGTVGNSSTDFTGFSVWQRYNTVKDMVIVGDIAYTALDYSEGEFSISSFNVNDPQKIIEVENQRLVYPAYTHIAWDGSFLYFAGHPSAEDLKSTFFSKSTIANLANHSSWATLQGQTHTVYGNTFKVGNLITAASGVPLITGLAVQVSSENLYIAREYNNTITAVNKNDGVVKQTLTYTKPKHCRIDSNGFLWFVHGDSEIVEKFTIDNSTGNITTTGFTITGFNDINAIGLSTDGTKISVADSGTSYDRVFEYNTTTGALLTTLGRSESYATDATIYDDKFMFRHIGDKSDEYGYIVYETDGSIWVNDKGNQRQMHFNSSKVFIEAIEWMEGFYTCSVDNADPTRVFGGWWEFSVDYSKTLVGGNTNQAWTKTKNWSHKSNITNWLPSETGGLGDVVTFNNGRTYTSMPDLATGANGVAVRIWELVNNGGLRDTGVVVNNQEKLTLLPNNHAEKTNRSGGLQRFYNIPITFDGSHNPIFGSQTQVGSLPDSGLIQLDAGGGVSGQYFDNGNRVMFFGEKGVADQYHLGGYDLVVNKFKWKAMKGVVYDTEDPYPFELGTFDARASITYHARNARTVGDKCFLIFHGEFFRQGQTNYIHVYDESGLPLLDFGADTYGSSHSFAIDKFYSNSYATYPIEHDGKIYVYQNDESLRSGIGKWTLSNLESIKKFVIPIQ